MPMGLHKTMSCCCVCSRNGKHSEKSSSPLTMDETEDEKAQKVTELVLELSLITSLPVALGGRDFIRASAAASSMASRTSTMSKQELRNFEWTIEPLVNLLVVDLDSPIAPKSAFVIRTLMESRVCMTRLMECEGLTKIAKVLDILMSKRAAELREAGDVRSMTEHLLVVYREIARFYPWVLVNVGGLRHCVVSMKYGDVVIQTISASTMASLSNDLEICKQMFSYGAIKPLITVSDGRVTNDACMLAGLGCITQLCRIPEIAVRMVQQGVVPLLEKALHKHTGFNHKSIREKALFALGFLSKEPSLASALCTESMLSGLKHEFQHGTMGSKTTILQLLMNIHGKYPQERSIVDFIRDDLVVLLKTAPWNTKNYALRVFCVLCNTDDDRVFFTERGIIDMIVAVVQAKDKELQEVPLVALLHLCVHPDIPFQLLTKGIAKLTANLLTARDAVIRELAVIVLKALALFNQFEVQRVVPKHLDYLLQRDAYNPQLYGAEYGGMIQEYLQQIVEFRRADDYLIRLIPREVIDNMQIPQADLHLYQNLFMELDAECSGFLGVDELKMLVVLKGEKMDKEEVKELLEEFDTDLSGNLDFVEFVIMLRHWDTKFGTGMRRLYNENFKRGAIGKASRMFKQWWNQDKLVEAQIQLVKERKVASLNFAEDLELQYFPSRQLEEKRRKEIWLRQQGLSYSPNYVSYDGHLEISEMSTKSGLSSGSSLSLPKIGGSSSLASSKTPFR